MEPQVKASDYKATVPEPQQQGGKSEGFVPDITEVNLRKLYLTENPKNPEAFLAMKQKTPARLGCGKAGARYKTLTMLRFRADHAAARDAVFSQIPKDFAEKHGLVPLVTRCKDKEEYLTRPDHGRLLSPESEKLAAEKLQKGVPVQIVIGDGLSSAAILHNAPDCLEALKTGLKSKGIAYGTPAFVRYCRVGAGDAIGDVTGCQLICMLVGERPGLVTDKSMSLYITYGAHKGIPESSRTVISNVHDQGTPAMEAGAYAADLIETILQKKVSGVGLHGEVGT